MNRGNFLCYIYCMQGDSLKQISYRIKGIFVHMSKAMGPGQGALVRKSGLVEDMDIRQLEQRTHGQTNGQFEGQLDGLTETDGWIDGQKTDGQMDKQMDGWTDRCEDGGAYKHFLNSVPLRPLPKRQ